MGMAYFGVAVLFILGLVTALSPEVIWHRQYGRMIEGTRPTVEGLAVIRRGGFVIMAFAAALAVFALWAGGEAARTRRAVESIDPEVIKRAMYPHGSPLDRVDDGRSR